MSTCFFTCFSSAIICFSNVSPSGEYVKVACCIILLWSDGNISSPARYSCLSVSHEDNADIFAASLLIFSYTFSSFS